MLISLCLLYRPVRDFECGERFALAAVGLELTPLRATYLLHAVLSIFCLGEIIISDYLAIYDLREMIGSIDLKAIVWHFRS